MGCFNSKVSADKQDRPSSRRQPSNKGFGSNKGLAESAESSHKNSLRLDPADSSVSLKTQTFRHVMHDPLGREYFMKFLKKEHAEENLSFFEEVENLKKCPAHLFLTAVDDLVQSFLIPGVETEVNISDAMKTNIIRLAAAFEAQHTQTRTTAHAAGTSPQISTHQGSSSIHTSTHAISPSTHNAPLQVHSLRTVHSNHSLTAQSVHSTHSHTPQSEAKDETHTHTQGEKDTQHAQLRADFVHALERAQKEIMMILAMGAFPRFIKSPFFAEYKRKAREQREREEEEELRGAETV